MKSLYLSYNFVPFISICSTPDSSISASGHMLLVIYRGGSQDSQLPSIGHACCSGEIVSKYTCHSWDSCHISSRPITGRNTCLRAHVPRDPNRFGEKSRNKVKPSVLTLLIHFKTVFWIRCNYRLMFRPRCLILTGLLKLFQSQIQALLKHFKPLKFVFSEGKLKRLIYTTVINLRKTGKSFKVCHLSVSTLSILNNLVGQYETINSESKSNFIRNSSNFKILKKRRKDLSKKFKLFQGFPAPLGILDQPQLTGL